MSPGFANIALFGSENGFNRFDNLILSDGNGNVILSDGFENGKYDYECFGGDERDCHWNPWRRRGWSRA